MPAPNKIITYRLENRLLELSALPGMTDIRIAEQLTQELAGKGSVSGSAVSRYRRAARIERASETRAVFQDHIKEVVPKDLEALEEIESWLLGIFRNQRELVQLRAGHLANPAIAELLDQVNRSGESFDPKTRANAAMMAMRVIELKLKYSGILEQQDPNRGSNSVSEIEDELGDDLERAISEVGTRKSESGIQTNH